MSNRIFTLPNGITLLRIVLAIPIIFLIIFQENWAYWSALVLMITAEFTDWLDGRLARGRQEVSKFGKIFDPMADSLYRVSVFTAFAANFWMPIWMLLIIVWRDISVSYIRVVAEQYVGTMGARQSGKYKAVAQGIAQMGVITGYAVWGNSLPNIIANTLSGFLLIATAVTAYSLIDYATSAYRAIK